MKGIKLFAFVAFLNITGYAENFRICESAKLPLDLPREAFKHRRNRLAATFQDRHSVNDVLSVFGREVALEGKFNFGLVGKDVFDEEVEIWIDNCGSRYTMIHRGKTNSQGRLFWTMPKDLLKTPGRYRIWMRLVSNGTGAFATLRLVAPGTRVAVFDVDGTLTAHETDVTLNVISELLKGCFSPPKRPYSSEVTKLLSKQGYEIVYLSGRHYFLNDLTRKWLAQHDFAPGTLMVTQSFTQIVPRQWSVGQYKSSQLSKIERAGIFIERAYGNALTDISRYKQAGIPNKRIFVVGMYSGLWDAVPLGKDFGAHYVELNGGSAAPP